MSANNSTSCRDLVKELDNALRERKTEEIFIDDVDGKCAAEYMHALKLLLRNAESKIVVFIDRLDQTLADGTLLYSNNEIMGIVMEFLKRSSSNDIRLVVRHALTSSLLKEQPLFLELSRMPRFNLYWAKSERVRRCESKIVIVDRRAYSFRINKYAWISFNNPEYAAKLSFPIEKAIRLSDTCLFDNISVSFLRDSVGASSSQP